MREQQAVSPVQEMVERNNFFSVSFCLESNFTQDVSMQVFSNTSELERKRNVRCNQIKDGENCINVVKQANKNTFDNIDKSFEEKDNYKGRNRPQRQFLLLFPMHIAFKIAKINIQVWPFILLIIFRLLPTAASPIQPKSGTNVVYRYRLLNTSQCNFIGLTEYQMCEQDDHTFNIFVKYCGYADQCGHGYKPVCAYDDEGQILHVCSPAGLTCQKEIRRRVSRVDADSRTVFVQEENCPPGRYRPRLSTCYGQCIDISDDVSELQELFRKSEAEYDVFDLHANDPDKKLSKSNEVYGTEMETDQDSELNQIKWKPNGIQTQNLDADELNVGKDWHVIIVVGLVCAALVITVFGLVVLLKQ